MFAAVGSTCKYKQISTQEKEFELRPANAIF